MGAAALTLFVLAGGAQAAPAKKVAAKPAAKIALKTRAHAQMQDTQRVPAREAARANGNQVAVNPSNFEALKLLDVKNLPLNPERAGAPTAERIPLEQAKRDKVTAELQGLLTDIIDLRLQTKEAHWDLVGPLYLPIHKQLDEFADRYAEYADRIAERSLSLGYSVDGRPSTVTRTSTLTPFPGGFVRDSEAIDLISDRLDTIALHTRERMKRVSDLDPVAENIMQDLIEGFEHDLWQIRVQK